SGPRLALRRCQPRVDAGRLPARVGRGAAVGGAGGVVRAGRGAARDRRALPDGAPVADRAPLAQGRPGAREGAPPAPESPARRALRCAAGLGGCAGARRPRARRPELLNAVPGWWRGRSRDGSPPDAGRAVRRALVAVLDGDLERAEAL